MVPLKKSQWNGMQGTRRRRDHWLHCKAVTWRLLLNAKIQRTTASHLAASLCMLTTLSEISLGFSQRESREGRFHSSESNYEHILSYTSIILTMMMIQKKEIKWSDFPIWPCSWAFSWVQCCPFFNAKNCRLNRQGLGLGPEIVDKLRVTRWQKKLLIFVVG